MLSPLLFSPSSNAAPPALFTWTGRVVKGNQLGRTIGFPTANLATIPHPTQLQPGVYVGWSQITPAPAAEALPVNSVPSPPIKPATISPAKLPSLVYYGPRHVLNETKNVFEVYIYDFDQEIYSQILSVAVLAFIRAPKKINTLPDLQAQLEADKQAGQAYFAQVVV